MGVSLTPTATLPSPRQPWPTGVLGLCFLPFCSPGLPRADQTDADSAGPGSSGCRLAFGTVVKPSPGALRALGGLTVQWHGPMSDPPHRCGGRHAAVLYFESWGGCRYVCGFTQSVRVRVVFLSCVGLARATSRDGAEGGRRESAGGTGHPVTSFSSACSLTKCLNWLRPMLRGRASRSCRVWLFVRQAGRI